ncbi:MAG TPA: ethanolamine ammonia-lyase reactivating factor EutA [Mycobacteriales bacterium]|nr:ethanolamine ammonia-lyase reactivating factor EutA [Mycobacteriales bacterium]
MHDDDGHPHSHAEEIDHHRWTSGVAEDGLEQHTLRSVGIDIGSATSHFTVSRLVVRRRGSALSSEFVVSERETVFRSPVWLTPYRSGSSAGTEIDTDRLRAMFAAGYRAAGIAPADLEVGAVVITGEALKKANAEPIARMVADWSGRFVCISAGHNQEAVLAAHGSGAVALSAAAGSTVVNVDIGGGTTKFGVVRDGVVSHVEVIGVGARLVAYDPGSRVVTRLEDTVRPLLDRLGIALEVGATLSTADGRRLGDLMAAEIVGTLMSDRRSLTLATDGGVMPDPVDIADLVVSGGVSEYLGDSPPAELGDLGAELGAALRRRLGEAGLAGLVRTGHQRIRATVVGASQFTMQASGQTVFVSDEALLPVRGLTAIPVDLRTDRSTGPLWTALRRHDLTDWHDRLAAVLDLATPTDHRTLSEVARSLAEVASGHPLFVVLRHDMARSLGRLLVSELGWSGPLVVVDGITVDDLDHLEIGRPMGRSGSLPVTVTSLEFPS